MIKKITFSLFLLFLITLIFSCEKSTLLNEAEREYLAKNDSVKVALFAYYPPYQFTNEKGEIDGIFIDYLNLIEKKTNYTFQKIYYDDWAKLIQDAKDNKIDVILEIRETESRKYFLNFYEPLFESKQAIVQRKNTPKIEDLKNFGNKTLILPNKYSISEIIKNKYPDIKIEYAKDDIDCLVKLNNGEYDAYVGPKAIINYLISNNDLNNLKISSDVEYSYYPGIAVVKSNKMVSSIFDKALNSISAEEKSSILDNWLFIEVTPFYRSTNFLLWICVFLVGLFIIVFSLNHYLKVRIKLKTRQLVFEKQRAEESNQLKSQFIKNISHEIRTPINGIIGYSQLLHDKNISSEEQNEYASIISDNCNELIFIIDNLLEVSKSDSKNVIFNNVLLDIDAFFDEINTHFQHKALTKKNTLTIENLGSNHSIWIDKQKFSKIIYNLVDNAIKFTSDGSISIVYEISKNELLVKITDTGIGIDTIEKETIFNYFSQSEKELSKNLGGLGLGLSIAKKNADLLGCQLTVESEIGVGTTFSIKKSDVEFQKKYENPDVSEDTNSDEKKTILIAEDGDVNYMVLKKLVDKLFDNKFEIIRAINGKKAVEYCENPTQKIDLVLMDIKMPIMDGYEATKQIKKIRPNLSVIAQTAFSTDKDIIEAMKCGCIDFIEKPIDQNLLGKIISKHTN